MFLRNWIVGRGRRRSAGGAAARRRCLQPVGRSRRRSAGRPLAARRRRLQPVGRGSFLFGVHAAEIIFPFPFVLSSFKKAVLYGHRDPFQPILKKCFLAPVRIQLDGFDGHARQEELRQGPECDSLDDGQIRKYLQNF